MLLSRYTTLVKCEPASKHHTLLPTMVEVVLWTALFFVGVYLVPFFLVPIVVKIKTSIDVFEVMLEHAFHACADHIEQLVFQPSITD